MTEQRVAVVIGGASGIDVTDEDSVQRLFDVCLTGSFIVAKHAGQNLREGGSLVSISSLNGRQPAVGMSAYCSAKAGLSMLTQVAALELGPKGVNAVSPGFVDTGAAERGVLHVVLVKRYPDVLGHVMKLAEAQR
ncbi:MAG: SDR family NAD(P)-dependent oxidoreductase [Mycobacterium sp.]